MIRCETDNTRQPSRKRGRLGRIADRLEPNAGEAAALPSAFLNRPIRVLVVDDSAIIRQILSRELERDPQIQVVGTAGDPYVARQRIDELRPDVLTLDVAMPRMDGITFLRKLMRHHPLPVIVLSGLTARGTQTAVEALEAGAVDVLAKPDGACGQDALWPLLTQKVKLAARSRVGKGRGAVAILPPIGAAGTPEALLALGASTGGVQALTEVLVALPPDAPGTVVVQHMPAHFTPSFARRLSTLCRMEVKEACDGDALHQGRVLIAPGGLHMLLRRTGGHYFVEVKDGAEVHRQRPSVDVLFHSVARHAGPYAAGALLTGMGEDGADGLLAMRRAGGLTLAQDEATCVVFGMPAAAIKRGAAEQVLPLERIAAALLGRTVGGTGRRR